jgi:hypothetical protein
MPALRLALRVAILGLPLWLDAAQDGTTAALGPATDLRTLRVDHRKSLLEALLPQKKAYSAELETLEKKFANDADFGSAIKARDERAQLNQEIMTLQQELTALTSQAQILHSAALPDRIVLSPAEAQVNGIAIEPKDKSLIGWKPSNSLATWRVPALPPGGYEVYLTYSCPAKGSSSFTVRESHYTLDVKITEPAAKPTEKLVGTLRVQANNTSISLSAEDIGAGHPVHIHAVTLVPANRRE